MRTIHVYRAAHNYFVDGIYWGDDAEGVKFYLQVTGVPPEEITKALEQVEQEGTYTGRGQVGVLTHAPYEPRQGGMRRGQEGSIGKSNGLFQPAASRAPALPGGG